MPASARRSVVVPVVGDRDGLGIGSRADRRGRRIHHPVHGRLAWGARLVIAEPVAVDLVALRLVAQRDADQAVVTDDVTDDYPVLGTHRQNPTPAVFLDQAVLDRHACGPPEDLDATTPVSPDDAIFDDNVVGAARSIRFDVDSVLRAGPRGIAELRIVYPHIARPADGETLAAVPATGDVGDDDVLARRLLLLVGAADADAVAPAVRDIDIPHRHAGSATQPDAMTPLTSGDEVRRPIALDRTAGNLDVSDLECIEYVRPPLAVGLGDQSRVGCQVQMHLVAQAH